MQSVAAYRFGANISDPDALKRYNFTLKEVGYWLNKKGAKLENGPSGEFRSLTGDGLGRYSIEKVVSEIGELTTVRLVEEAHTEQMFITEICIIYKEDGIELYTSMSVTGSDVFLEPRHLSPHCPAVIRRIISAFSDWEFGGQGLPNGLPIRADDKAQMAEICKKISCHNRTLPILVVSLDRDECVWENLHEILSRELIGVAYVCGISEEMSWEMTNIIGEKMSCYLGAIKLYWPVRSHGRNRASYILWTPDDLREYDHKEPGLRRFVAEIRRRIMSVAAQVITAPKAIRDIHVSSFRENIGKMESEVRDRELNFIIEENDRIVKENEAVILKNSELSASLEYYKERMAYLVGELGRREAGIGSVESPEELRSEARKPERGEIKYYKKIGNKGGVDVMEHVGACNHREGAWQSAFRADQAEKGITKLENSSDWQSLQHCGSCTGGGRWRVKW